MREQINIAVLVSGGGTNLQALIDAQKKGLLHSGKISLVISNNSLAYALKRAKENDIPSLTITKKQCGGTKAQELAILRALEENHIDLIILAGFLKVLSKDFTSRYDKRILNVHPSLIPSFCGEGYYGLKVHEEALKRGVKISGATVHYVNEIADGGEIILQKAVAVEADDTPETLQKRVMRMAEWQILPKAAEMVSAQLLKEENKA